MTEKLEKADGSSVVTRGVKTYGKQNQEQGVAALETVNLSPGDDPKNPQTWYFRTEHTTLPASCTLTNGGQCGLFKSTDGGATFTGLSIPTNYVSSVSFGASIGTVYAASSPSVPGDSPLLTGRTARPPLFVESRAVFLKTNLTEADLPRYSLSVRPGLRRSYPLPRRSRVRRTRRSSSTGEPCGSGKLERVGLQAAWSNDVPVEPRCKGNRRAQTCNR
jgi:hypothetical protein